MLIRYYNNNGSSFLMLPSFGFSITLHYEYCFLDVIILLYLLVRIYKNYLLFFVIIIALTSLNPQFFFVMINIQFYILDYNIILKTKSNQLMSSNICNVSSLLINFLFIMHFGNEECPNQMVTLISNYIINLI